MSGDFPGPAPWGAGTSGFTLGTSKTKKATKSAGKSSGPSSPTKVSFPTPTQRLLGGKRTGNNGFGTPTALDVKGLQQMLVKAGYKLAVDGQMGPQTLSALRDYYGQPKESLGQFKTELTDPSFVNKAGGVGHPQQWNDVRVNNHAPDLPVKTTASGQAAPGSAGYNLGGANVGGGTVNLDPAAALLSAAQGKPLPTSMATFGQLINPSTAQDIAGAQYDPQIAAAQLSVNEDPLQAAQNLKDIGSWYGQVGKSQQIAAANDAKMTQAGTGSIADAANALVQSLGGGANQGAADVAAAGQNATGTIAALGAATDNFNSQIAPLLAAEGAEQKTNQSRLDAKQLLADRTSLASLQSAKGQAAQAALAQIQGENNSLAQARAQMAAQLAQYNNSLAQQGFNNQLSLSQTQIAAMLNGLKAQYTASQINKNNSRETSPFLAASPAAKLAAAKAATAAITDQSGAWVKMPAAQAWQKISDAYRALGYNPAPGTPSWNAAQGVLSSWQTGLPS